MIPRGFSVVAWSLVVLPVLVFGCAIPSSPSRTEPFRAWVYYYGAGDEAHYYGEKHECESDRAARADVGEPVSACYQVM